MLSAMKRVAEEAGAVTLFALLTVVMTWPLAANFTTALAHPEDPSIVAWILDWDFYALWNNPARLFHANIFHPHPYALAFTENLLGIALVLFPLHLAGASPIVILNAAMLLAFTLSGYGAYVLGRLVTGSAGAALCGGIYFAFFSFRFTHLTHLQHLWALWLPLMLAALICFARRPTAGRAALLGVCFVMNGLSNLHWLAFGGVAIGLSVFVFARHDRRYWIGAGTALATACLALVPVLLPYQRLRELHPFRGDPREVLQFSARFGDWAVSSLHSRWYGPLLGDPAVNPERWLFPGGLVLLFALAGLFRVSPEGRRPVLAALLWIALGLFGSLGLNGVFGRLLFEHVPLFDGIRAPARWSFIAYTGLALLATCGIAALSRALAPSLRARVQFAIACALLIELQPVPLRFFLAEPQQPPLFSYLASQADQGPIVHLPLRQNVQYEILRRSTAHHRPMVNGVSGGTPRAYSELALLSESSPISAELLPRLEAIGVTTLVIHGDRLGSTTPATVRWLTEHLAAGDLLFLRRFDAELHGDYVFATRRSPVFGTPAAPEDLAQRSALGQFLAGQPVQNEATFGWLESPVVDQHVHGRLRVAGWALSPWGIRSVDIRLANGRQVIPAELGPRDDVSARYPWYPMTTHAGFAKEIDPKGLPAASDVQIEIVDGRGRRTRLPHVWFIWTQ